MVQCERDCLLYNLTGTLFSTKGAVGIKVDNPILQIKH